MRDTLRLATDHPFFCSMSLYELFSLVAFVKLSCFTVEFEPLSIVYIKGVRYCLVLLVGKILSF